MEAGLVGNYEVGMSGLSASRATLAEFAGLQHCKLCNDAPLRSFGCPDHQEHANAAVTQTIYAHGMKGADDLAAASIGRLFEDPETPAVATQ